MDVAKRVDAYLEKRSCSDSVKSKVRRELLALLNPVKEVATRIEQGRSCDDGIPVVTKFDIEEKRRIFEEKLRQQTKIFFGKEEEVVTVESGSEVADINEKLTWGYTLLHFAACKGDEAECERLLSLGANLKARDNGGRLPWEKAEMNGHKELAIKLKPQ